MKGGRGCRTTWAAIAFLLAVLSGAGTTHASLGGPTLAVVLVYDARSAAVYVRIEPHDEAPSPEVFGRFALSDTTRGGVRFAKVSSRAAVPAGLRALRPMVAASVPQMQVVASDSVQACGRWTRRYRVRIDGVRERVPRFAAFDVLTLRAPAVSVLSVWAIPGRAEMLAILRVDGDPCEAGWETQLPVILRPGAGRTSLVDAEGYR